MFVMWMLMTPDTASQIEGQRTATATTQIIIEGATGGTGGTGSLGAGGSGGNAQGACLRFMIQNAIFPAYSHKNGRPLWSTVRGPVQTDYDYDDHILAQGDFLPHRDVFKCFEQVPQASHLTADIKEVQRGDSGSEKDGTPDGSRGSTPSTMPSEVIPPHFTAAPEQMLKCNSGEGGTPERSCVSTPSTLVVQDGKHAKGSSQRWLWLKALNPVPKVLNALRRKRTV
ncbi:hypothetical protein C8J57DRAFT_1517304 [Mycena rebaudengoi]|nr:hypothetical protein C8J57DRAFT_1517304 [Mycena rebaudengoi]